MLDFVSIFVLVFVLELSCSACFNSGLSPVRVEGLLRQTELEAVEDDSLDLIRRGADDESMTDDQGDQGGPSVIFC